MCYSPRGIQVQLATQDRFEDRLWQQGFEQRDEAGLQPNRVAEPGSRVLDDVCDHSGDGAGIDGTPAPDGYEVGDDAFAGRSVGGMCRRTPPDGGGEGLGSDITWLDERDVHAKGAQLVPQCLAVALQRELTRRVGAAVGQGGKATE